MRYHADNDYVVLYRYMERQWAEEFTKGNIRINTLYGYQIVEHEEIGDAWEGFRVFEFDPQRSAKEQLEILIKNYPHFAGMRNDPNFATDLPLGCPVQITEIVPDCYMLCFTSKFNAAVMRDFGADTCIEIRQPKEFFFSVSRALQKHAIYGAISACQYIDRGSSIEVQSKHRPQVLKPEHLKHQAEVRFVWDPLPNVQRDMGAHSQLRMWNLMSPDNRLPEVPLKPIFIKQPEVAKFCRILGDEEVAALSAEQ